MSRKPETLSATIKQRRPFRSKEQEAYLSLVYACTRLSRSMDEFLKHYGISQPQLNVLRILRGAVQGGLGRNEISGRLVTAAPDMTRLLVRLEKSGLVKRERGADDLRAMITHITPTGLELLTQIDETIDLHHRRQFAGMDRTDINTLTEILRRMPQPK